MYPKPEGFWQGVWKIALGVCFGILLASLITTLVWFGVIGLVVGKAAQTVRAVAKDVENQAVVRINESILEYERVAAGDADEIEKAAAASQVATAFRRARDLGQAAFWENNAKVHRDAAAAGRRTRRK